MLYLNILGIQNAGKMLKTQGNHRDFCLDQMLKTRMHSSRMRTSRSLTVCQSLLRGGVSAPGGGIPACTEADSPVNRMTDTSKNITLAITSLRPVKSVSDDYDGSHRSFFCLRQPQ